jgi:hypothetical protein
MNVMYRNKQHWRESEGNTEMSKNEISTGRTTKNLQQKAKQECEASINRPLRPPSETPKAFYIIPNIVIHEKMTKND